MDLENNLNDTLIDADVDFDGNGNNNAIAANNENEANGAAGGGHGADQPPFNVNAISANRVKIPPFWEQNPNIWFARVEAQFKLSNIRSENTKFDYLVGQIESKVLQQVSELVINQPANLPYTKLKAAILERFSAFPNGHGWSQTIPSFKRNAIHVTWCWQRHARQ